MNGTVPAPCTCRASSVRPLGSARVTAAAAVYHHHQCGGAACLRTGCTNRKYALSRSARARACARGMHTTKLIHSDNPSTQNCL